MATETHVFQILQHDTGVRSDPFTMSCGALAKHLKKHIDADSERGKDYVLVLMEIGVVPDDNPDFFSLARGSNFSRRPVLTVRRFIETFEGL